VTCTSPVPQICQDQLSLVRSPEENLKSTPCLDLQGTHGELGSSTYWWLARALATLCSHITSAVSLASIDPQRSMNSLQPQVPVPSAFSCT